MILFNTTFTSITISSNLSLPLNIFKQNVMRSCHCFRRPTYPVPHLHPTTSSADDLNVQRSHEAIFYNLGSNWIKNSKCMTGNFVIYTSHLECWSTSVIDGCEGPSSCYGHFTRSRVVPRTPLDRRLCLYVVAIRKYISLTVIYPSIVEILNSRMSWTCNSIWRRQQTYNKFWWGSLLKITLCQTKETGGQRWNRFYEKCLWGWELDGIGSESCPVANFGISGVAPSGSASENSLVIYAFVDERDAQNDRFSEF
jgi:hypothetical protein